MRSNFIYTLPNHHHLARSAGWAPVPDNNSALRLGFDSPLRGTAIASSERFVSCSWSCPPPRFLRDLRGADSAMVRTRRHLLERLEKAAIREHLDREEVVERERREDAERWARYERELYFRREDRLAHSDREYLLDEFESVRALPAADELFDPAHIPLWSVGPSGDAATSLLQFWQRVDSDSGILDHDFTDPDLPRRSRIGSRCEGRGRPGVLSRCTSVIRTSPSPSGRESTAAGRPNARAARPRLSAPMPRDT